jgi:hypothetical protein
MFIVGKLSDLHGRRTLPTFLVIYTVPEVSIDAVADDRQIQ